MTVVATDLITLLRSVEDPELPVSIVDLGMVKSAAAADSGIVVELVPTFLGCPAKMFIEADVIACLAETGLPVTVRWTNDNWSVNDVTPLGRDQLTEIGIAVPGPDGALVCPHCGSANFVIKSDWGSTLCRKLSYCPDCQTPSEILKGPAPTTVQLMSRGGDKPVSVD